MSEQVASHTRGLPAYQGMIVTPSGHFPSTLESPEGSRHEGILAVERANVNQSSMSGKSTFIVYCIKSTALVMDSNIIEKSSNQQALSISITSAVIDQR